MPREGKRPKRGAEMCLEKGNGLEGGSRTGDTRETMRNTESQTLVKETGKTLRSELGKWAVPPTRMKRQTQRPTGGELRRR